MRESSGFNNYLSAKNNPKYSTPSSKIPHNFIESPSYGQIPYGSQIDRQNIIDEYKILRLQHRTILSAINMSQEQKQQLFGFNQSAYCINKADQAHLVTVNDFFRGKRVMKEGKWKQREQQKRREAHDREQQIIDDEFAELDIHLELVTESQRSDGLQPKLIDQLFDNIKQRRQKKEKPEDQQVSRQQPSSDLSFILNKINQIDQLNTHQPRSNGNQKPYKGNKHELQDHEFSESSSHLGFMFTKRPLK